jgi:hypothetical protein
MTTSLEFPKEGEPCVCSSFVDPSLGVVINTCSGEITFHEVLASIIELRSHPQFKPGFRQLGDLAGISGVRFGIREVQEIYRAHDPFSNQVRRAMVTAGAGPAHDLACAYQLLVAGSSFGVFQSMQEALSWLDLGATMVEPTTVDDRVPVTRLHRDEPLILDLPPDVPRTFRGIRAAAASKHKRDLCRRVARATPQHPIPPEPHLPTHSLT